MIIKYLDDYIFLLYTNKQQARSRNVITRDKTWQMIPSKELLKQKNGNDKSGKHIFALKPKI